MGGAARLRRFSLSEPLTARKHRPQVDPETDGPVLPTKASEEYKPFTRKVPEFKFWEAATRGTLISLCCTVTQATDVPVFWPILVVYFFTLLDFTLRDRVAHMVKHKYLPCSWGKKKYAGGVSGGAKGEDKRPAGMQSASKPAEAMFRNR